jgi:hypothetical protein
VRAEAHDASRNFVKLKEISFGKTSLHQVEKNSHRSYSGGTAIEVLSASCTADGSWCFAAGRTAQENLIFRNDFAAPAAIQKGCAWNMGGTAVLLDLFNTWR